MINFNFLCHNYDFYTVNKQFFRTNKTQFYERITTLFTFLRYLAYLTSFLIITIFLHYLTSVHTVFSCCCGVNCSLLLYPHIMAFKKKNMHFTSQIKYAFRQILFLLAHFIMKVQVFLGPKLWS